MRHGRTVVHKTPWIALAVACLFLSCASDLPATNQAPPDLGCPPSSESSPPLNRMIRVAPQYPERALQQGLEGYVRLVFKIDPNGRPQNVRVTQDRPDGYGFGDAALVAVREWRYCPYSPTDPNALTTAKIAIPFKLGRGPRRITIP